MTIAVPVESDKSTIAKKTGQAAFFAVYENEKNREYVENRHGHGNYGEGHEEGGAHHKHEHMQDEEHVNSHKKDISGIANCDVILVRAVGEHMQEALRSMGLEVKKVRQKDGATADEVVKMFLSK